MQLSVRKELKIRPGFTPQEDVGRFKTTRQVVSEITKSTIPGSNRTRPIVSKEDNPFAQPTSAKSKAQLKNEKRRGRRRAAGGDPASTRDWDESDDDDEDNLEGGLKSEFERLDMAQSRTDQQERRQGEPSEMAFPPLAKKNGSSTQLEAEPLVRIAKTSTLHHTDATDSKVETLTSTTGDPNNADIVTTLPVNSTIEQPWRTVSKAFRGQSNASLTKASSPEPRKAFHPNQVRINGPDAIHDPPSITSTSSPRPRAKTRESAGSTEPRIRKEIKVKEGGATDMSSLADRVKKLVVGNQKDASLRDTK